MADPRNIPPGPADELQLRPEPLAARARRRRRVEAAFGVPDDWSGFSDTLRPMLEPVGLEAARRWSHLRRGVPLPCTLDEALDAGLLLDMDAETVGRALQRAELVVGTAGFVTLNPAVPF